MAKSIKYNLTQEELAQAYLDCRRRKRSSPNSMEFEIDDSINLNRLYKSLIYGDYEIDNSIAFCVEEPVKREIFAAGFRDCIVHHLVINRTMENYEREFIQDSYSCRIGKGTDYGINRCREMIVLCSENYTKETYILKCDLKSFFMTIDKNLLFDKLKDFLVNKCNFEGKDLDFMMELHEKIVFNKPQENCVRKQSLSHWEGLPADKSLFNIKGDVGLPIGNLTSQIFANFFLNDLDRYVTEELGFEYYGRYVDDFFIIHNDKDKLLEAINLIRQFLAKLDVTLHPKKIYLQEVKKGVTFLGKTIKPNRTYAGKRTIKNFRKKIREWSEWLKSIKTEGKEPTNKDIHDFIGSMNSYFGYLVHCASYKVRKNIMKSEEMKPWWEYVYLAPDIKYLKPYREFLYLRKPNRYLERGNKHKEETYWFNDDLTIRSPLHF